jgi:hypothetical protein
MCQSILRNVVRTQTTGCIYFGHLRVTSNRLHVESPTVLQALFRQSPGSSVAIFIAAGPKQYNTTSPDEKVDRVGVTRSIR